MSWSKCCYLYHNERQGRFVGDIREGELIVTDKNAPMTVNFYLPGGRYGVSRIQACIMVELKGEYELMVAAQSKKGIIGGLNSLLGHDFDHELNRRITSNQPELTRKLMQDENLRRVLQEAPQYIIKLHNAPGEKHLLKVYCLSPENGASGWPICAVDDDYGQEITNADVIRAEFYPAMDQLLIVTRAVRDALAALNVH